MFGDENKNVNKMSKCHFWAGALTDSETVPLSFLTGGTRAAKESVKGVLAVNLLGAAMIAAEYFASGDNND